MSKIDELLKDEKVEWKKLGEVCREKFWIMPTTPKFSDDFKIPYITGKNIKDGEIDFDKVKYISEEDYLSFIKNRSINKDDILISMIGTIGEIGIVKENNKFYGQNLYLLRLNSNIILTRYFYHYFTQSKVKNSLVSKKNSSSQGYIRAGNIENLEIPIPSIETQEKIVKTLDKFTNYVTELQTELQARTKQYEYYRDMLLSEEYLNKLSNISAQLKTYSLKSTSLGEIAEIRTGSSNTNEQSDNGIFPFYVRSKSIKKSNNYEFDDNEAIIIPGEGGIGEIFHYVCGKYALHQRAYRICLTKDSILTKFVYYYMIQNFKKYIIKNAVSATVTSIRKPMIEKFKIVIPNIEIQNKIVEILDKFQPLLADTKGLLPQEIEQRQKQYEYYREKLLTFDENSVKREREREHISLIRI